MGVVLNVVDVQVAQDVRQHAQQDAKILVKDVNLLVVQNVLVHVKTVVVQHAAVPVILLA